LTRGLIFKVNEKMATVWAAPARARASKLEEEVKLLKKQLEQQD